MGMCHFSSRAGFSCDGCSMFFCRTCMKTIERGKDFFKEQSMQPRGFEDELQPIPNGFE